MSEYDIGTVDEGQFWDYLNDLMPINDIRTVLSLIWPLKALVLKHLYNAFKGFGPAGQFLAAQVERFARPDARTDPQLVGDTD